MCWAVVFVGVLFGLTNRTDRVRPYKAAAASCLLYVLISYPSMVYIVQMYYQMDFDKDTVCKNYFHEGNVKSFRSDILKYEQMLIQFCKIFTEENAAIYGYPSSEQSNTYCYSFRITTFLGVLLFVHMHIECYLCIQMANFNTVAADTYLKDDLLTEGDRMLGLGLADNSEASFLFPRYCADRYTCCIFLK